MNLHQKLEQLIASWPDDRSDPPDTEYQRGYMAAAEEHARELKEALRTPAPVEGVDAVERVARAMESLVDRDIFGRWCPKLGVTLNDLAESALSAMPGAGVADAVSAATDAWWKRYREGGAGDWRDRYDANLIREDVRRACAVYLAALSAAPPPVAESRAGEVISEIAVERLRAAENVAANLRAMLLRIERKGVQPPPADDDQITALAGRIVDNLKVLGRPAGKPDPVEQDRAEWNKEQRW